MENIIYNTFKQERLTQSDLETGTFYAPRKKEEKNKFQNTCKDER